jgi:hypothetical protein
LVLVDAELEIAFFEGCVSKIFEITCYFEDLVAGPLFVFGLLVFRVVFIGVAGRIYCFLERLVVVFPTKLAAV